MAMAKKNKIKFTFDLPLLCGFAIISMLLVVLDAFVLKGKLMPFIVSPTTLDFNLKNPLSYFKIIFHIFGAQTSKPGIFLWLYAIVFVVYSGQEAEKTYGTVFLGIMAVLSSVFSGVLAACFLESPISSAIPVAFLLCFLTFFANLKKNTLVLSSIIILVAVCAFDFIITGKVLVLAIDAAGGLCGSLLSFMAVPNRKPKNTKKTQASKTKTQVSYHNEGDDDTTVIGTFEL